jgi:hypothetical protein
MGAPQAAQSADNNALSFAPKQDLANFISNLPTLAAVRNAAGRIPAAHSRSLPRKVAGGRPGHYEEKAMKENMG